MFVGRNRAINSNLVVVDKYGFNIDSTRVRNLSTLDLIKTKERQLFYSKKHKVYITKNTSPELSYSVENIQNRALTKIL